MTMYIEVYKSLCRYTYIYIQHFSAGSKPDEHERQCKSQGDLLSRVRADMIKSTYPPIYPKPLHFPLPSSSPPARGHTRRE